MNKIICMAFWAGLCLPQASLAESVYRWVDDKGQVHYGNQPPPKATKFMALPSAPKPDPIPAPVAATQSAPPASAPPANGAQIAELQQQLQVALAEAEAAAREYNSAKAVRLAGERNYAKYLDRIRPLEERARLAEMKALQLQERIQSLSGGR